MTDHEEVDTSENMEKTVCITELEDLEEQKEICSQLIQLILDEEKKLQTDFTGIQTLYDILEKDPDMKLHLSEFIGYNYGTINSSLTIVENSIANLKNFMNGSWNEFDAKARGMYISIWYNMALDNISIISDSNDELAKIEADVVSKILSDNTEEAQIFKGQMH